MVRGGNGMSECERPYVGGGFFGPGGVGFWVFLLILALLGFYWAQGAFLGPVAAAACC